MNALPRNQVAVLVPAAGRGERLGLGPKVGLELGGRPLLDWVVDKALQVGDRVIVACTPGATAPSGCTRIEGGPTRQDSVLRLVRAADRPWHQVRVVPGEKLNLKLTTAEDWLLAQSLLGLLK